MKETKRTLTLTRFNKKTGKNEDTEYFPVNEKVKDFRNDPKFTGFSLTTEIYHLDLEKGEVIFKAIIKDGSGNIISSAFAREEKAGKNPINATCYLENAETSAVGRALSFLGIHIKDGLASKEEIESAMERQASIKASKEKEQQEEEPQPQAVELISEEDIELVSQLTSEIIELGFTPKYHTEKQDITKWTNEKARKMIGQLTVKIDSLKREKNTENTGA